MTPEGKVKDKLKAHLRQRGFYYFFPVQTGYGATSLDVLACQYGQFYAYECKADGKDLTPRQKIVARQLKASGARVFKVTLVNGKLEFTPCGLTEKGAS